MIINNRRLRGMQAYKEKGTQDYMMIDMMSLNASGLLEGLSTAIAEQPSSLAISSIQAEYLSDKCRPMTWKQLPQIWKEAFLERLEFPEGQLKEANARDKPKQKKFF